MDSEDCKTKCDYPEQGVHFKAELLRLSTSYDRICTRLDGLQTGLEILIRAEHSHVDDLIRTNVETTSEQLKELSRSCEANARACAANAAEVKNIKALMARSVAIWASITAAIVALVPTIVEILRGKF